MDEIQQLLTHFVKVCIFVHMYSMYVYELECNSCEINYLI